MLKKFVVIFLSALVLLSVPLTAIAVDTNNNSTIIDDTSNSNINTWNWRMWSKLEADPNFVEYRDTIENLDVLEKLNEKDFICFLGAVGTNYPFFASDTPIVDFYQDNKGFMLRFDNLKQYYDFRQFKYLYTETTPTYSLGSNLLYYSDYSSLFDSNRVFIVNDLDVYNQIVNHAQSNGFDTDNIYYCADPVKSFRDYVDASKYDDMLYDVYPLKDGYKNIIRFYDWADSYKGKLDFSFYDDYMLNYLNSSLSLKTDLYYTKEDVNSNEMDTEYQHQENINLYIPVDDDFINSHTASEVIDLYMEQIGYAVHFYDGPVDFRTWYNKYVSKYLKNSEIKLVQLKDIEPSSDGNVTVNNTDSKKNCWFIRLPMPNYYSFLENHETGLSLMTGCRTMSTAQLLDLSTGKINNGLNGFGSDIDGADYADDKSRDDLLTDGWKNGYPNTKGDFPYKITMNKNGSTYFEIYFDKKPKIKANFITDSQISYDINFNLTKGYIYHKNYNCSYEFDFRSAGDDDALNSNGFFDSVTDDINNTFNDSYKKLCNFFGINYNYSTIAEFEVRLWTNYTGSLTNNQYRGYYVQFNWDVEHDPNFIKTNSDDDHNYSDDYLQDDPVTDNNGNIHGGAVERPTEGSSNGFFNNDDFSFDDNTLWSYANQFLSFCAKAFRVLPSWVWALIGSGIVIIIVLRILGR